MITRLNSIRKNKAKYHTAFIDMDGVLVDWSGGVCDYLGVDITDENNLRIMRDDLPIEQHFCEGGRDEFVSMINDAGYDFWYNLELLPWAKELFKITEQAVGKFNTYFLTSHSDFPSALQAKVDYVKHHFGSDRIVVTKYKSLCAKDGVVLIDDMDYNINPFRSAGGDAYKWPNQWKLKSGEINYKDALSDIKFYLSKNLEPIGV